MTLSESELANDPGDLDPVEESLLTRIAMMIPRPGFTGHAALGSHALAELFEAQVLSRLVDHTARFMRLSGVGFYTIGSSGHESNAAVALALRPTDPALLHYRSGGFYMARSSQVAGIDPVDDVLRGMFASVHEPISGGRHKVFGRRELNIIPQTSTISSHPPRAVGLARSLDKPNARPWVPSDSVVVCSLGDASLNHSSAQGAMNWASNASHRGDRVPVLFVVENNGIGISVRTPTDWVARSTQSRWSMDYAEVDGADPDAVFAATASLAATMRESGRPAILHLRTVRFLGHAGSDVETAYRSPAEIRADYERDPIVGTARRLVDVGDCAGVELVQWYLDQRMLTRERALALATEPRLSSAEIVMAPISPQTPEAVRSAAWALRSAGQPVPASKRLTLAQTLNATLDSALSAAPEVLVFGEDVARKGGVYGVTRGLQRTHGEDRVFDTILDEQTVLGMALGSALNGFLPVPEIQYLAYLHNAEDQLRGEAATLSFFSNSQFKNPMVVRVAGYGYQKGFGGHYHNDNSVAVLRDIPGLVVASPSHADDAGPMLRTCLAAAQVNGTVSAFVEPIALYHTADLHDDGDQGWLSTPGVVDEHVPIGRGRTHGDGGDLTIVSWANGLHMSLRVQRRLAAQGIAARVLDLRWLAPLPVEDLLREACATDNVLIADETRRSGGVGEALIAELVEGGFSGAIRRVSSLDSFIPLGDAANLVMLSEEQIYEAAITACR